MWNRQVFHLFLFLAVDLVLSNSVVFRADNLVQVKGANHTQLECEGDLCSHLTEITCTEEHDLKPNSCVITNQDTAYFNRSIVNAKVVCNDDHKLKSSLKDNCYLVVSSKNIKTTSKNNEKVSNLTTNLLDKELIKKFAKEQYAKDQKKLTKSPIRDPFDNPFDDDFEKGQKQSRYIMVGFIIIFALVFVLMITAICKGCCTEAGIDPCVSCRDQPVISESARRRISFPRNNYAISNNLQTAAVQPTFNPSRNVNYNSTTYNNPVVDDKNTFADPPPSYSQVVSSFNTGQNNQMNQGNVNYGYASGNYVPNFQNQHLNHPGYPNQQPTAPSAPPEKN